MSYYKTGRSYLYTKTLIYKNRISKNRFSDVFIDTNGSYLNPHNLFMAYYNTIPNCIMETAIDCKKARVWFENNFPPPVCSL